MVLMLDSGDVEFNGVFGIEVGVELAVGGTAIDEYAGAEVKKWDFSLGPF